MTTRNLSIAVGKGRLESPILDYFAAKQLHFDKTKRNLTLICKNYNIRMLFVKNSDLSQYVHNGIVDLGIAGSDTIHESEYHFVLLGEFPFGKTKICLIAKQHTSPIESVPVTSIASKYTRITRDFVQRRQLNAEIIPLQGSVELAPRLGLAPYIIDLVDTGDTIKANNLVIQEEIGSTSVQLIANQASYKLHYRDIDKLVELLQL